LDTAATQTHLLLQRYTPPSFKVKPGGRLATIFANVPVLDAADRLLPDIEQFIVKTLDRVTLEKIEP
jgi:hypothetical protein